MTLIIILKKGVSLALAKCGDIESHICKYKHF